MAYVFQNGLHGVGREERENPKHCGIYNVVTCKPKLDPSFSDSR